MSRHRNPKILISQRLNNHNELIEFVGVFTYNNKDFFENPVISDSEIDLYKNKRVAVIMPAYNAEKTLIQTYNEIIEQDCVDDIIIVDDNSQDNTVELAQKLPRASIHVHEKNLGYGANQKTCYKLAIESKADIVIMVHPDYQYTPKIIPALAAMIGSGFFECVVASRILGGKAVANGMPLWRYISNRIITVFENLMTGAKLSEYHSGYRAYSTNLLKKLPFDKNSDDFIFDNQMLLQILFLDYPIGEVSCPTRYLPESSSINFFRSLKYGFSCLWLAVCYRLAKMKIVINPTFKGDKDV